MVRKCYKCGMCMFQCPIYSVYRNETYSAKGKINAIDAIINKEVNVYELDDVFRECNLCRHCSKICPGEIDITSLVIKYRHLLNSIKQCDRYEHILNNIKKYGNPYEPQKNAFKNNKIYDIDDKENIDIQNIDKISGGETLVFFGCTIRHNIPGIVDSVLNFLDKLHIEYIIMEDEPCCGNILYNIGYIEDANIIAKANKAILNKFNKIITLCPGCYSMFKSYKNSKFEVFYILDLIYDARQRLKSNAKEPLYFQIPCHIYNSKENYKNIISEIMPLFGDIDSSLDVMGTKCCGAGGGMSTYNKNYLQERMDIVLKEVNVNHIMTSCPFCYLNFKKNTSKNVSFITENLDVENNIKIELKKRKKIVDKHNENNIMASLVKYKISSSIKKLFYIGD